MKKNKLKKEEIQSSCWFWKKLIEIIINLLLYYIAKKTNKDLIGITLNPWVSDIVNFLFYFVGSKFVEWRRKSLIKNPLRNYSHPSPIIRSSEEEKFRRLEVEVEYEEEIKDEWEFIEKEREEPESKATEENEETQNSSRDLEKEDEEQLWESSEEIGEENENDDIIINENILDNTSKKLELREPNQRAVQAFLNHYYNSENNPEKLSDRRLDNFNKLSEYILSVATGVGKTYIIAAILNYLAEAEKITNFLIVAPGKIIREKTINNFSPNKPNSLVDKLTIKLPHIIDIKNFHTAKTTDKNSVKLFIFTVQSLTQVRGKTARKTGNYDELLGASLRDHLSKLTDLVIFADEHHLYYGEKFSEAIRELKPKVLIGLTGTPHEKTPPQEIIFEYPLWKALVDKLIKIPVMVGRYDGYQDEETKLKDAIKLLEAKQILLDNYTQQNNLISQKALMITIAPSIEEAENIRTNLIVNCQFPSENICQVDSSKITDDLAQELQNIDNPHNPTRIIIAVGMLKEGWDVKSVYVIVPLRAFKSATFIEQIIGRGLRLPFGSHTSKEALNTLEIIMHDNFQELLNVRKSLKNKFFGLAGEEQKDNFKTASEQPKNSMPQNEAKNNSGQNIFNPQSSEERQADILRQSQEVVPQNRIKEKFAIKILRQKIQPQNFSLKIIEIKGLGKRFKELGENFSSQKEIKNLLQRFKIEVDPNQRISWKTADDEEFTIEATQQLPEEEKIKRKLFQVIFRKCSFINSANPVEISSANRLVDKFLQASNLEVVSQYWEAVGEQLSRLIQVIFKELHVGENQPEQEVIEKSFSYYHPSCEVIAKNLEEEFVKRTKGYQFAKSLYNYDTFDSGIEFQFACLINKTKEVKKWIRLLQWGDEIYILYGKNQRHYFPDFLVIDENDIHWLVEIKDDNNPNPEIDEKNQAAKEWVNALNLELGEEARKNEKWRFLYITKGNMSKSHEKWDMLKKFCRV
ncbi:MAG: DEAD/DEAH box helicase family protein [Candidatus Moeniiplasma glomeromycotorum]|nr:DEAD/DEAH box helicase family protein [Candidatus Moeniiplasma glomeromycotorum]MCE8162325.1 DEAD/DEAH box helicase family protein [Candidatus Moeniiplasma glomeromycotorum]MCE8166249.1 DEAD/DEAH box helicase family protein [Candidatus Moeniiplasma glomeromycotorum]MCE8166731.1 DEAD/DEAH box helicase family protein [Candidatus Moeniiplasma glomeromycotorum]